MEFATIINGTSDHQQIACNFANHFAAVCSPFDSARNAELKSLFYEKLSSYIGSPLDQKQLIFS
jgi:hypothetical protein